MNRKILLMMGVIVVGLVVVAVVALRSILKTVGPTTITVWGLWEDASVFGQVADDYKRAHSNVTVRYIKQSPISYRERALAALAREDGPDIVRIHNSWMAMFSNLLAPAPKEVMSAATFRATFYPVAVKDLMVGGLPYAIPLEIDDLALYVNQDILTAGGVSLPSTWEEFRDAANKLTVRDSNGRIKTAGAAVGTASNVDHWQDILGLMMLQAGVDLNKNPGAAEAADVLSYYTTFVTADRIWDETLDNSTLAFAKGTVAMYLGPSWRYFDIKNINPTLKFKVIPAPQLTGGNKVNYASFWAEGVSRKSKNGAVAWDFLKFISSKEELAKLYAAEARLRVFGEPYSRVDMGQLLAADPNVGPFISQAQNAGSWYLASFTNDGETGINSRIAKYYQDGINAMLRGSDAKSVLETIARGVAQVLGTYGVTSGAGSSGTRR